MSLRDKTESGRLASLKELRGILAESIDLCESTRDLASLTKQYRDVLAEIESLEGDGGELDEIARIISRRG